MKLYLGNFIPTLSKELRLVRKSAKIIIAHATMKDFYSNRCMRTTLILYHKFVLLQPYLNNIGKLPE